MKFGTREICDVVLRAKATQKLGSKTFYKHEPVLRFDTLKTSSLEGAATTVYAQGGRGNARLVAWEGDRTLTFTFEDALISPESFAVLSGAGLVAASDKEPMYVHVTSQVEATADNTLVIEDVDKICWNGGRNSSVTGEIGKVTSAGYIFHKEADIFCMKLDNGEIAVEPCVPASVTVEGKVATIKCVADGSHVTEVKAGDIVMIDYYVQRIEGAQMIEIEADKFGGNYYLEGSTLFRREADGVDMPAEFIIPNGKIQSNFTFTMASTGDPSTFSFTMDAFPDYTKFNKTKKVMAAIQIISDDITAENDEFRDNCDAGE